jgi:pilus assembly protein CpaF
MRKIELLPALARPDFLMASESSSSGNRFKRRNLSTTLVYILESVQREISLRSLEHEASDSLSKSEIYEELIDKVSLKLGFELSAFERDELLVHLEREQQPFGILQKLVDDPQISDIIISGYDRVCVQQGRRNFLTDIKYPNQQSYENFIEKMLFLGSSSYSTKKPIADAMIADYARLHVVHSSLCQDGPYLTIRLNRFSTVSISDLLEQGLAPEPVLNYLRGIVLCGQTILIAGEVGTGKTTLARALAAAIPEDEAILVIEDTAEIQLQHPHVRYVRTREDNSDGVGKVSPCDCIRAGMRMAMNRIIFGEMRDSEAAEAFVDVCASGHPGLSTIHARSAQEAVSRLELFLGRAQKGATRSVIIEQIATAVQVIVFVDFCAETSKRRIIEIREIGPVADGTLRTRQIFSYTLHKSQPIWRVCNKVSAHKDKLEELNDGVFLASYPLELELETQVILKEVSNRGRVF